MGEGGWVDIDRFSRFRRLFGKEQFEWAFKMARREVVAFFEQQDIHGDILQQRSRRLRKFPQRYALMSEGGEALVGEAWRCALEWGQVEDPGEEERSLSELGSRWEPDLLMLDFERMSFAAGVVCFPSSWSLTHSIGKPLVEVHGVVPRLNESIGDKIERFLKGLKPGRGYGRENWSFTLTDDWDYHPDLGRDKLDGFVDLREVSLRLEHQVFTGVTGGVLMGLRIETLPLVSLSDDEELWRGVIEKVRTMPEDVALYKGMARSQMRLVEEMSAFTCS